MGSIVTSVNLSKEDSARTDSAASLRPAVDVVDMHSLRYWSVPDLHGVPAQVVNPPSDHVGGSDCGPLSQHLLQARPLQGPTGLGSIFVLVNQVNQGQALGLRPLLGEALLPLDRPLVLGG